MSFITKLSTKSNTKSSNIFESLGFHGALGGISTEKSLVIPAVYRCVNIIAGNVAQIPLKIFQETFNNGNKPAVQHRLYKTINSLPHPLWTSYAWKRFIIESLLTDGNAYCIQNYVNGELQLIPVAPSLVTVEIADKQTGKLQYRVQGFDRPFPADQMFIVNGPFYDGIRSKSPIRNAAETLSVALSQREWASRFYSSGIMSSGVITTPSGVKLDPDSKKALKEKFQKENAGVNNSHSPMLLEGGLQWTPLKISAEDAQIVQSMGFSIQEISRIFGVPLQFLSASQANITEMELKAFNQNTIRPLLTLIEQEIDRELLTPQERRQGFTAGFVPQALLETDAKSQGEILHLALNDGAITHDEYRGFMGMAPAEDGNGKVRMCNGNFTPVSVIVSPEGGE
jgi:HK97 family phage portal protein